MSLSQNVITILQNIYNLFIQNQMGYYDDPNWDILWQSLWDEINAEYPMLYETGYDIGSEMLNELQIDSYVDANDFITKFANILFGYVNEVYNNVQ